MSDVKLISVPFHNDTIQCVEHEGKPYVPVRPIVENLGVDWGTQYRKLLADSELWTVVQMTTVARDGAQRETLKWISFACHNRPWRHMDLINKVDELFCGPMSLSFDNNAKSLRFYHVGSCFGGTVPYYAMEFPDLEKLFISEGRGGKEDTDLLRCFFAFFSAGSVYAAEKGEIAGYSVQSILEPEDTPVLSSDDVYKDQTFDMSF